METLSENLAEKPPPPEQKNSDTQDISFNIGLGGRKAPPPKICALFIYKRFEGYKKHLYSFHIYTTY